jgi:hypothetical protein
MRLKQDYEMMIPDRLIDKSNPKKMGNMNSKVLI